jgi:hypothetical protein
MFVASPNYYEMFVASPNYFFGMDIGGYGWIWMDMDLL